MYSEFGIPCYIIFDGDYQNVGTEDEKSTIAKNHGILELFGNGADFPDDTVTENYLGFKFRLEENLGIGDAGKAKALRLYQRTRAAITDSSQVPEWVMQVIERIKALPAEATSILKKDPTNPFPFEF